MYEHLLSEAAQRHTLENGFPTQGQSRWLISTSDGRIWVEALGHATREALSAAPAVLHKTTDYSISHLELCYRVTDCNDDSRRLMAEKCRRRKDSCCGSEQVRVAESAGLHVDEHLVPKGCSDVDVFYYKRTARFENQ